MRHVTAKLTMILCLHAASAAAQIDARMLRYPDVSETQIAFVYAGDIWVVSKEGGAARRLSSPPGEEAFPRFSPDGTRIAFMANYDGNPDVYVIPTLGGTPARVTWYPGMDRILDWTPDGEELLLASNRQSGLFAFNQMYRVSADGGLPVKLPVPYGEFGTLSPDGNRIAYTPETRGFRTWKRYRGGAAPEIWILDLDTLDAQNVSDSPANDAQPMWHGDTLYFLSDRGPAQRANIWAHDLAGGTLRQVTTFTDFDITFPASGPSDLVFQAGGRLYRLALADERLSEVAVDVVTDMAARRSRTVQVGGQITSAGISPTGQRAVFEARGEVFTVPAKHGAVRNLTHSSGAADRFPAWSPDGRWIAFWCDNGGEYELTLVAANGTGEPRVVTTMGAGFRYRPFWSPDSSKLAFIDHTQQIRILDLDTEELTAVDRGLNMLHPNLAAFEASWSHDSRWLTYARSLQTNNRAVFLFDTESGERVQATSGYYNDFGPVFDPDGRYLYYYSNRKLAPVYSDLDDTWVYPNSTSLVAVALRADVPSPLAPRNDDEPAAEDMEETGDDDEDADDEGSPDDSGAADADDAADETGADEPLSIDLEGFEARAVILPVDAGVFGRLRAAPGKVVFHRRPRRGTGEDQPSPVAFYDLEAREERTIVADADSYEISADRKKLLVSNDRSWAIVDAAPDQTLNDRLATGRLAMTLDPADEWRQMFREVWRTYRDYFYDEDLHGLDWEGLGARYGDLLDQAVTRWDVNFVLGELIGEVNASHTYVGGGDTESARRRGVGLLGVDWALEDGAYRIARIVRGAPWDIELRSPLDEPGIDVDEGDYVLAVNGNPLDPTRDPYAAFEGLAGATVLLTVNDTPTMEGAREVAVETLSFEAPLRRREWIERNRRRVDEASDGRIGYIYVPNTAVPGQTELVRQFNHQHGKHGLIIDERWNAGGQLPDRFVELMNRRTVGHIYFRHGAVVHHPAITHAGHKAMLINGQAGSGGDAFPWFFREMEAGVLIGERTWGGLIGPSVGHRLIDGGFFTAPPGRLFRNDGRWFAEGHGVEPDIAVTDHPGELARGIDPQLEAAIDELLRRIEADPPATPAVPAQEHRAVTDDSDNDGNGNG